MEESAAAFGVLETDMDFLKEAYRQVAECRRMLRWTYAFGFFVEEQAKLELFQMLQTDAETSLERLHGCAEKERVDIVAAAAATVYSDSGDLVPQAPAPEHYAKYREKLSRLTMVTRDHFENLARAFRDGLSEVDTTAAAANAAKAAEKAAERADPVASTRFLFTQEDED
jgi:ariadne-1